MKEKEIELLKKQLAKLDNENFDLEAWKTGAVIILERIFGPENQKTNQIEKIKYDQSSWALREAKGSTNMMEACKKQGREILEIAIDELEILEMPSELEEQRSHPFKSVLGKSLENELKISEYRKLLNTILSDKKHADKKKEIIEVLHNAGHDVADNVLADILINEQTKKYLNIL